MKTTILDDLDIPEDRREALRREALRRGVSVGVLFAQWLSQKADQILGSSPPPPGTAQAVNTTALAAGS